MEQWFFIIIKMEMEKRIKKKIISILSHFFYIKKELVNLNC